MYVADEKSVLPLYGCVFVDLPVIVYIHTHHTHHTDKIFNPIVIHILCIPESSVFLSIASDFQT